jgi:protease I
MTDINQDKQENKKQTLSGHKVAILATDGFEKSELFEPKKALEGAGAVVDIVSFKIGKIKSWDKKDWGPSIEVDLDLDDANPEDFDALVLPGGVMNPDSLRKDQKAVEFVRSFVQAGKPIGAICHGPWTLIEADGVRGRIVTSWPSLQTDLRNAGADWVDEEVVTDNGLVTSRKPDDLPAFNRKLIEEIAEGRHNRSQRSADLQKPIRSQPAH